jgi:hypothetical protein
MTDDLVQRLRVPYATADSKEAADRIEALERALNETELAHLEDDAQRISELEAALREIFTVMPAMWTDKRISDALANAHRALEGKV